MAAGLPVLGVNKLAVPEVIHQAKNGYLSEPFNYEEMAIYMLKILESDKKLERFGLESIKIASEHEIINCKNKLFKTYEKVANS